jgi:hypothetical protein
VSYANIARAIGRRYSQHRQRINQRLRKSLRDEKIVRIATITVWAGALAFFPLILVTQWMSPEEGGLPAGLFGDVIFPVVFIFIAACSLLALPMLILYVLRYRRALDRARADARDTTLMQLQETVAKLAARLPDDEEHSSSSDP